MSSESLNAALNPGRLADEAKKVRLLLSTSSAKLHRQAEFSWTTSLSERDRRQMIQEISAGLGIAVATGDWSRYDDALYSWRATAEVLSAPELTAQLLVEHDPAQEVPLRRP